MSLQTSLPLAQSLSSRWTLRSMQLSSSVRRILQVHPDERSLQTLGRCIRELIRRDFCSAAVNLLRLPGASDTPPCDVLITPSAPTVTCDDCLTRIRARVFVRLGRGAVRELPPEWVSRPAPTAALDLRRLTEALPHIERFAPATAETIRRLQRGTVARDLKAQRWNLWEYRVREIERQRRQRRPSRILSAASFYLVEVTEQVIPSVLQELYMAERRVIKTFISPGVNITAAKPRRSSLSERSRNRRQAVDCYPFLADLWYPESAGESPQANSLLAQLSRHEKMVIRRGIDAGTPIADVLARELQLAPWMIDHLRRHWEPFLFFDRGYHPDRRWDVGGMLSLWTPETAPTTLDELHRLNALLHPRHDRVSPLYRSIAMPIGAQDRRQLRELVQHEGAFRQMQGYLLFLHSLTQWIEKSLGIDCRTEIGRLLGANNLTDWGVLNRRFQEINGTQAGRVRPPEGHLAAPIQLFWPSLLTKEEPIGEFRFRCLHSTIDLSDESRRMKNCASNYVARCMFGESHLLHIATTDAPIGTLEVKKEMYGDNAKILLVHSEGIAREPLTPDAAHAVEEFLDGCNRGRIRLTREALLSGSRRVDLLEPMIRRQCIDYPSWLRADLGTHYFALHTRLTGTQVVECYRTALERHTGVTDSLYQWALRAVHANRPRVAQMRDQSLAVMA